MNPAQIWEQLQTEHPIWADQSYFTTLMGNPVEPRRGLSKKTP